MSKVSYKIIYNLIVKTEFNILNIYIYRNRLYTYKYTCMCVFGERESFPMVCFYFIGMYPRHNIAVFIDQ